MGKKSELEEKLAAVLQDEQDGNFDRALSSYNAMLEQFHGDQLPILWEMAAFLFRSRVYGDALGLLVKCHQSGYKKAEIESFIMEAYYEPNIEEFRECYEQNIAKLHNYSGILNKKFPAFDELHCRFVPFSETRYIIFDQKKARFTTVVDFTEQTVDVSANPQQIYLIKNEYNLSNLIATERVTRIDNTGTFSTAQLPLYFLYDERESFVEHLQIFSLGPLLERGRTCFLFGQKETSTYFGTDLAASPTLYLNMEKGDDPYFKIIEEAKFALVKKEIINYQNLMHMFQAAIDA